MVKRFSFSCIALTLAMQVQAQEARHFVSAQAASDYLEIRTSDGTYLIKPYSDKVIETSFVPAGEQFDPHSHAVVDVPEAIKADVKDEGGAIDYSTGGLAVHIVKEPFAVSYTYHGKPVIAEKGGYAKEEGKDKDASRFALRFALDDSEVLYGGGARALGMNRRGYRLQLYNKAHYGYETHSELMNYTMPLVLSSKMYAIHFDNPQIGPRPDLLEIVPFTRAENLRLMQAQAVEPFQAACTCPGCGHTSTHRIREPAEDEPHWAAATRHCSVCEREWAQA